MKLLVDTNVLIDIRKSKGDKEAQERYAKILYAPSCRCHYCIDGHEIRLYYLDGRRAFCSDAECVSAVEGGSNGRTAEVITLFFSWERLRIGAVNTDLGIN